MPCGGSLAESFWGWGLGSNDSANIFGTGVAAGVIRYRTAIVLTSIFLVVGALLEGHKSMHTVGGMSTLTHTAAFLATISAGLCMAVFSYLSLPVSTSQAIVGAVIGIGIMKGSKSVKKHTLVEIAVGWASTPLSSGLPAYVLMRIYLALGGSVTLSMLSKFQARNFGV